MQALIVVAHPCADSFTHANLGAVHSGLESAGHTVDVIDLYADGFTAAMSRAERAAYEAPKPILDPQIADYAKRLMVAEIVVFVYPTWWSTVPAILKGWFDRVLVPGVGFRLDERSGKVRPALAQVRHLVGVSTYGSPKPYVRFINDNGRRMITRTLRLSCGWRARPKWFGLYSMDTTSDADRRSFLEHVEREMEALR